MFSNNFSLDVQFSESKEDWEEGMASSFQSVSLLAGVSVWKADPWIVEASFLSPLLSGQQHVHEYLLSEKETYSVPILQDTD